MTTTQQQIADAIASTLTNLAADGVIQFRSLSTVELAIAAALAEVTAAPVRARGAK